VIGGPQNNMIVLNFWNYELDKLHASAVVKPIFDKFTMHPTKPKHVTYLLKMQYHYY
jgi:hypothetical protein